MVGGCSNWFLRKDSSFLNYVLEESFWTILSYPFSIIDIQLVMHFFKTLHFLGVCSMNLYLDLYLVVFCFDININSYRICVATINTCKNNIS